MALAVKISEEGKYDAIMLKVLANDAALQKQQQEIARQEAHIKLLSATTIQLHGQMGVLERKVVEGEAQQAIQERKIKDLKKSQTRLTVAVVGLGVAVAGVGAIAASVAGGAAAGGGGIAAGAAAEGSAAAAGAAAGGGGVAAGAAAEGVTTVICTVVNT